MGVEISALAVRRSIFINAAPERVWQEFESLAKMQAWFGTGHTLLTYEPQIGGMVELEVEIDGERRRYGGRITVLEPGREVTFEDEWIPSIGWDAPSLITLRLTPSGSGTVVELFHHGFERIGEDAAEQHRGFEGGWTHLQLEALRQIVEA